MGEWKECLLGEVLNLKRGYDLPNQDRLPGRIPIISSSGTMHFHSESKACGPGVVTGRYGTIGEVFYTEGDYWPLNTTLYVQDFKGNHPKYIYYLLKGFDFGKYSDKSAVPGVNRNDLHTESVIIPDIPEQKAIAEVLSSLDDKIDLLHRQNKTLESLGQTLFRQWFIEETDDSWDEINLSDIADHFKDSVNPSKEPAKIFNHYSLPAFDEGMEPKPEIGASILSNKYKVLENTILISKLNPRTPRVWPIFGTVNEDSSICSTEFQVVKPKNLAHYGFIYYFLKSYQVTHELSGASGGTSGSHQRVNPDDIFNLGLLLPTDNKIIDFNKVCSEHLSKIRINKSQIGRLSALRDLLLPKLMSGDVIVQS